MRFYRYASGFLHEKAMLIDQSVAAIGTANLDNRSFRLNFEITAVIARDQAFLSQVERMFLDDFDHAREVPSTELSTKSPAFRVAVRLARLTSPIQ